MFLISRRGVRSEREGGRTRDGDYLTAEIRTWHALPSPADCLVEDEREDKTKLAFLLPRNGDDRRDIIAAMKMMMRIMRRCRRTGRSLKESNFDTDVF